MSNRLEAMQQWLENMQRGRFEVELVSGDASFRKYYRVKWADAIHIVMDAPPDKEDCGPFIKVAEAMAELGLNVPRIFDSDLDQGFLLLSDLGDVQYAGRLADATVDALYADALDALVLLQTGEKPEHVFLPPYNHALLMQEMQLFSDWFVQRHLGIQLGTGQEQALAEVCELLAESALQQQQVWVHRDFHSRNLMVCEGEAPGVLDFQDAVVGPVTYDLVSLLRDCYVAWPDQKVYGWLEAYRKRLLDSGMDLPDQRTFQQWFDWMGVQRHMKAIGIFSRLKWRDDKPGYLGDIPRTLSYVISVSKRYPALQSLHNIIESDILPRLNMKNGMPL